MRLRGGARDIALSAWILAMLSFSWMYSEISVPNERTRAYLTAALVDDGTLNVDGPIARYGMVYDLATHAGHFYTDKAPGSSLLAVPLYAVARKLDPRPEVWHAERIVNLVRNGLMIPAGVLGFLLLRWLLRRQGREERTIDLVSIGYALGCAVFHYSTAFYGHVLVAVLLLAALSALTAAGVLAPTGDAASTRPAARYGRLALAGLAAGMAGLTEYQAAPLALLLGLPILLRGPERLRSLAAYAAGGLPCALLLLAYNQAAFGGPFQLSYQHLVGETLQAMHASGVAGATAPTKEASLGLLLSPHRGLVSTAPWLGLGLLSLLLGMPRAPRTLWLTCLLGTAYMFVAVASSSVWHGSWAFGPRLMIPAMPLLAIATAALLDRARRVWPLDLLARAAVIFSVLYQQLVQVTFSEPPPEVLWPLSESVVPVLRAGAVAPNLMCKLMPLGPRNLVPLAVSSLALSAFLAAPRASTGIKRALRGAASLLVAALGFVAVYRAAPEVTPAQQAGWAGWMGHLMTLERSCTKPPTTTP